MSCLHWGRTHEHALASVPGCSQSRPSSSGLRQRSVIREALGAISATRTSRVIPFSGLSGRFVGARAAQATCRVQPTRVQQSHSALLTARCRGAPIPPDVSRAPSAPGPPDKDAGPGWGMEMLTRNAAGTQHRQAGRRDPRGCSDVVEGRRDCLAARGGEAHRALTPRATVVAGRRPRLRPRPRAARGPLVARPRSAARRPRQPQDRC